MTKQQAILNTEVMTNGQKAKITDVDEDGIFIEYWIESNSYGRYIWFNSLEFRIMEVINNG
jgi:hypothetical protein